MSKTAQTLLVFGIGLFVLGPLIGLCIVAFSMGQSFHDLGQNGITDPSALAGHIGNTLVASVVGFIGALIGVLMMGAAGLLAYAERKEQKTRR